MALLDDVMLSGTVFIILHYITEVDFLPICVLCYLFKQNFYHKTEVTLSKKMCFSFQYQFEYCLINK